MNIQTRPIHTQKRPFHTEKRRIDLIRQKKEPSDFFTRLINTHKRPIHTEKPIHTERPIHTENPIHLQALHAYLDQILPRFSTPDPADPAGELTTE